MKRKSEGFSNKILSSHGALGRREFLQSAIVGAGAAALGGAFTGQEASAKEGAKCEVLLLSCMDFRLLHHVANQMVKLGHKEDYDHVILAGSSLGANNKVKPGWGQTFWDHVALAVGLHEVSKVVVIDHRSCGAYQKVFGRDAYAAKEKEHHTTQLQGLKKQIKRRHPTLNVELYLMDLSGNVEVIS